MSGRPCRKRCRTPPRIPAWSWSCWNPPPRRLRPWATVPWMLRWSSCCRRRTAPGRSAGGRQRWAGRGRAGRCRRRWLSESRRWSEGQTELPQSPGSKRRESVERGIALRCTVEQVTDCYPKQLTWVEDGVFPRTTFSWNNISMNSHYIPT